MLRMIFSMMEFHEFLNLMTFGQHEQRIRGFIDGKILASQAAFESIANAHHRKNLEDSLNSSVSEMEKYQSLLRLVTTKVDYGKKRSPRPRVLKPLPTNRSEGDICERNGVVYTNPRAEEVRNFWSECEGANERLIARMDSSV